MARKATQTKYYEGIGRRKSSTARVRLFVLTKETEVALGEAKVKKGEIIVNKKPAAAFFPSAIEMKQYMLPLTLTENEKRFAISAHVRGGGKNSQLEAFILGMARALEKSDKSYRPALKKEGLLSRDARIKERRKVGTGGKARRQKQSPKR